MSLTSSIQRGWFDKKRKLGKGSYGIVYAATYKTDGHSSGNQDCRDEEEVAVKRHLVDDKA